MENLNNNIKRNIFESIDSVQSFFNEYKEKGKTLMNESSEQDLRDFILLGRNKIDEIENSTLLTSAEINLAVEKINYVILHPDAEIEFEEVIL